MIELKLNIFSTPIYLPNIVSIQDLIHNVLLDDRIHITPAYIKNKSMTAIISDYLSYKNLYTVCFTGSSSQPATIQVQANGTDFKIKESVHVIERLYDMDDSQCRKMTQCADSIYVLEDQLNRFHNQIALIIIERYDDGVYGLQLLNSSDTFDPDEYSYVYELRLSEEEYVKFLQLLSGNRDVKTCELSKYHDEPIVFTRHDSEMDSSVKMIRCESSGLTLSYHNFIDVTNTIR